MLNKLNPTYVYVALVVAVLLTMLVGLLSGGAGGYLEGWNTF